MDKITHDGGQKLIAVGNAQRLRRIRARRAWSSVSRIGTNGGQQAHAPVPRRGSYCRNIAELLDRFRMAYEMIREGGGHTHDVDEGFTPARVLTDRGEVDSGHVKLAQGLDRLIGVRRRDEACDPALLLIGAQRGEHAGSTSGVDEPSTRELCAEGGRSLVAHRSGVDVTTRGWGGSARVPRHSPGVGTPPTRPACCAGRSRRRALPTSLRRARTPPWPGWPG